MGLFLTEFSLALLRLGDWERKSECLRGTPKTVSDSTVSARAYVLWTWSQSIQGMSARSPQVPFSARQEF